MTRYEPITQEDVPKLCNGRNFTKLIMAGYLLGIDGLGESILERGNGSADGERITPGDFLTIETALALEAIRSGWFGFLADCFTFYTRNSSIQFIEGNLHLVRNPGEPPLVFELPRGDGVPFTSSRCSLQELGGVAVE